MSPAAKNGLLLAVLIVALGGAVFFYARSARSGDTGIPKGSPKTQWMCDKCQKHYELDVAEYQEWFKSADKRKRDPNLDKIVIFWCADCKTYTVVRANVKPETGEWYFVRDSQGNQVKAAKPKAKSATP